jgi:predicted nucleic acid-binding protein
MKILLDTNIVIHREAATIIHEDIGVLFRWLDNLHYTKCIHPVTVEELGKHEDPKVRKSLELKLSSYNILKTKAPIADQVSSIGNRLDENLNDRNERFYLNQNEEFKRHGKGVQCR